MTYATLMVRLELGRSNAGLLNFTCDLAERLYARIIGIAAGQPMLIAADETFISGDLMDLDRAQTEKEIGEAETEFRNALQACSKTLEWRSSITFGPLSEYLSSEARSADLIISGGASADKIDTPRWFDTGDLVMRAGRPVLIVPSGVKRLSLDRVIVGWKDTREARRAIFDALPLLTKAARVTVVEVADEAEMDAARDRLADVVGWLERHGVSATSLASPSSGGHAGRLGDIADEQGADIIVAGAYGHSRMREWVLGGVTRDLLLDQVRCSLVSH